MVVNDEDGTLAQKFNIKAYPTTFIYDKNQNLKFSEVGYSSYFGLYLRLLWSQF
jgi:thioredoxin-related protein